MLHSYKLEDEDEDFKKIDKLGLEYLEASQQDISYDQETLNKQIQLCLNSLQEGNELNVLEELDQMFAKVERNTDATIDQFDLLNLLGSFVNSDNFELVNHATSILKNITRISDYDIPVEIAEKIVENLPCQYLMLESAGYILTSIDRRDYAADYFLKDLNLISIINSLVYRNFQLQNIEVLLQIASSLLRYSSEEALNTVDPNFTTTLKAMLKSEKDEIVSISLRCLGTLVLRSKYNSTELITEGIKIFLQATSDIQKYDKNGFIRQASMTFLSEFLMRVSISDNEYKSQVIFSILECIDTKNNPDEKYADLLTHFCSPGENFSNYYEIITKSKNFQKLIMNSTNMSFQIQQCILYLYSNMIIHNSTHAVLLAGDNFGDVFQAFFAILPRSDEKIRFSILKAILVLLKVDQSFREYMDQEEFVDTMEFMKDLDQASADLADNIIQLAMDEEEDENMVDILPF
ncbi:hypothetical protein TVAG_255180 [Trichomonas vaginalis G3]|uniref:Uncharacterized protein n=1 Tax=Trichomonas vaginalis (strain ATCC PRA-98 / G3) TaxID=412133 RepID=A2FPX8_TRIV3|nr:armadillo (ARM) repeat-containing protein family [Trichomonas vaginalis G3]EAX93037.1 hypothetical protein TVAG_255180 [Trichomonas vaginalis G3]KAI5543783.1 armadillo (ARM) repeat-containing protein family [Trichomonas vaginalis G3]|eukprot:XP_001305967.1 hypothetical protein [Trichomonas vaginalis G3]